MTGAEKLVVGASGLVGSHVTRQLVNRGDDVRVLIRRTSSTKALEDRDIEHWRTGLAAQANSRVDQRAAQFYRDNGIRGM